MSSVGDAYSRTGAAWERGPARVYDRLAEELVACAPGPIDGGLALDLGSGTGAATRALLARGALVVAVDAAVGMLQASTPRVPCAVGDAVALPLRSASVDLVVAAFSLNHLSDPVVGLRESARVVRPGGLVLGSAYAHDDGHVAKQVTERAAGAVGWTAPPWYRDVQGIAVPQLATVERAHAALVEAGCDVVLVEHRRTAFPELGPRDLVEWRLGMAQMAPFIATLTDAQRTTVVDEAAAELHDAPPLVRSFVVFAGRPRS
jgi:SAM-dependent methyltransferase